jgi:hypothetical protein
MRHRPRAGRLWIHRGRLMLLVAVLAGVIWGIGAAMGVPRVARLNMLGLLYVAVLAVQVALPEGHPAREATGGSPALWLILGGFVVLVLAYRAVLNRLRGQATSDRGGAGGRGPGGARARLGRRAGALCAPHHPAGYRRRRAAGAEARPRCWWSARAASGRPALLYLAAAGVGRIGIIDADTVALSNLQRQVIHTDARQDMPKVFSAQVGHRGAEPPCGVRPYNRALTEDIAEDLFAEYDLILDGTDSYETRALVNRAAVAAGSPGPRRGDQRVGGAGDALRSGLGGALHGLCVSQGARAGTWRRPAPRPA